MPMNKNTFLCNYDTDKFQLKNTYDGIKLKGVVHFNEDILDDCIYIIRNYNELRLELLQEKTNANEYETKWSYKYKNGYKYRIKNDVIKALKEIELKDDGVVIKVEFETDICKNEDIACEKVNISINKKKK